METIITVSMILWIPIIFPYTDISLFPRGGGGVPGGGMLKLLFEWYIIKTLSIYLKICTFEQKLCYQFESRQIFS